MSRRRRITSLDVLGEVRRAQRILRRVERYLAQQERAERRAGEKRKARDRRVPRFTAGELKGAAARLLELGEQG